MRVPWVMLLSAQAYSLSERLDSGRKALTLPRYSSALPIINVFLPKLCPQRGIRFRFGRLAQPARHDVIVAARREFGRCRPITPAGPSRGHGRLTERTDLAAGAIAGARRATRSSALRGH